MVQVSPFVPEPVPAVVPLLSGSATVSTVLCGGNVVRINDRKRAGISRWPAGSFAVTRTLKVKIQPRSACRREVRLRPVEGHAVRQRSGIRRDKWNARNDDGARRILGVEFAVSHGRSIRRAIHLSNADICAPR